MYNIHGEAFARIGSKRQCYVRRRKPMSLFASGLWMSCQVEITRSRSAAVRIHSDNGIGVSESVLREDDTPMGAAAAGYAPHCDAPGTYVLQE